MQSRYQLTVLPDLRVGIEKIKVKIMKKTIFILLLFISIFSLSACQSTVQEIIADNSSTATTEPVESTISESWSEETHGNETDPDYETVFPQDEVNRINITIDPENWDTMLADMTELMGEFGDGGDMGPSNLPNNAPEGFVPGGQPPEGERPQRQGELENMPDQADRPEGGQIPPEGNFDPGGRNQGNNMNVTDENPVWVTATIEFEGDTWEHVGIRFKGNSSLKSAWSSGSLKIPFRLDFDQFEDDYPETEDQRFYGFKQLSLANNFNDDSFLREKVTADIFREFGVPSAHTAFYEVYVDYGEGPEYFGLYTMVEMVEDTVIEEQFSSDEGNLYKPEGTGATFADGSFNEASFDKETNQEEVDYSDIISLYDALHADNRLSEPEAWRDSLESVFDVDIFLRWLAVNTVVQNWDTYGLMSHNYFLYTNPENGLITWIPWDNNHALFGAGRQEAPSLSLGEITDRWPLIRFLMDDPIYEAQYQAYCQEVVETVFVPEEMTEIYTTYHELVAPSVLAETSEATTLSSELAFDRSLKNLIDHINERYEAVMDYLENQSN